MGWDETNTQALKHEIKGERDGVIVILVDDIVVIETLG